MITAINSDKPCEIEGSRKCVTQGYFVSPLADSVFIIFSPFIAFFVMLIWFRTDNAARTVFSGDTITWPQFFIRVFTQAHVFAVFFRSHLNTQIFNQFRFRFLVVPPLVFAAMYLSDWVFVFASVTITFWDVYHSSAQTFGIARIYESRAGNSALIGRKWDLWLNHFLYIGPILAGANLLAHIAPVKRFNLIGLDLYQPLVTYLSHQQTEIRKITLAFGLIFLLSYLFHYVSLLLNGHRFSVQKLLLLTSTGFVSILSWGFLPMMAANFVVNFFHALQYFAILWWTDQKNLLSIARVDNASTKRWAVLGGVLGLSFGYGFVVISTHAADHLKAPACLVAVISFCHFWFDGFIWSVRKRSV